MLHKLPAAVPGFPDYNPKHQVSFDNWISKLEHTFKIYGFTPFHAPLFIRKEFLRAKSTSDTEIYSISRLNHNPDHDDIETKFGLPFDNTVPLAIWVRDNARNITFPYKRYTISPVFRGEHPSPGRFRGFYQCDLDIIGPSLSIDNDFQCLLTLIRGLQNILIDIQSSQFTVYLNDISITRFLLISHGVEELNINRALSIIDRLDKDGAISVTDALSSISNQTQELVEKLLYKGNITKFIDNYFNQCTDDTISHILIKLKFILTSLENLNIMCVKFSPAIVRGLNYYTGIVFETFLDNYNEGSIMSGGRYNNLIDIFSDKKSTDITGVGGSIGISRLFDIVTRNSLLIHHRKTVVNTIIIYENIRYDPWLLAETLRTNGISTDVFTGNSFSLTKQLDYAGKIGIPIVIILLNNSLYCVKNLITKDQTEITTIPDLLDIINKHLNLL